MESSQKTAHSTIMNSAFDVTALYSTKKSTDKKILVFLTLGKDWLTLLESDSETLEQPAREFLGVLGVLGLNMPSR